MDYIKRVANAFNCVWRMCFAHPTGLRFRFTLSSLRLVPSTFKWAMSRVCAYDDGEFDEDWDMDYPGADW